MSQPRHGTSPRSMRERTLASPRAAEALIASAVRVWFDEDLSPTLVQVAIELGHEATCNRDRDMLGSNDRELRLRAQSEGYVLVTDNASDFRPMYDRESIHPGLVLMPGAHGRENQQRLARIVLEFIDESANRAGEPVADFMINKLAEIDEEGACEVHELPEP